MPSTDDRQQTKARKQSNLAFAFRVAGLDAPRRRAMEIFYTFCRVADDIVDEGGDDDAKRAALDAWRATIRSLYRNDNATISDDDGGADNAAATLGGLAQELAEVVKNYALPEAPLLEILDGCAMDIGHREYADADALHVYCHGVACAVGLVSQKIFGCVSPLSQEYAVALGYALQFTNILRDVAEDYHELGRIYLPRDEMAAFGVAPEDLAEPSQNPACARLFAAQYFRAKHYFNKARRLVAPEDNAALRPAFVMGEFYEAILEKIKASGFRLTRRRVRLSRWEKLRLLRRVLRGGNSDGDNATNNNVGTSGAANTRPRRVVVVGGGVAGIAAAADAALAGDTVTLLEAQPALGGRAGSFAHAGQKIDHGHHALFGCYRAFLRLAGQLGVRQKLFAPTPRLCVAYHSPDGRRAWLRAWRLPAPLGLAGALVSFGELSWRDRWALAKFALALKFGRCVPTSGETAAAWLARCGQTAGAVRAVWEPFCVAALNEPLSLGDAALLRETARRLLFGNTFDATTLASREPLGHLFEPELRVCLRGTGGAVRTSATAREICKTAPTTTPTTTTTVPTTTPTTAPTTPTATAIILADGSRVEADVFILAAPPKTVSTLLCEKLPALQLRPRPILNVHLFTDGRFLDAPFYAGLLDSPVQWVFDEDAASLSADAPPDAPAHYTLTLSCPPEEWLALPSSEIVVRAADELRRFFPAFANVRIVDSLVCKCPNATFPATPAAAPARPSAHTAFANVFLAGDWTNTGLPSTLEGAAQSGQFAAALARAQAAI
jgi:squalene-associated FAD-dependent desaturase